MTRDKCPPRTQGEVALSFRSLRVPRAELLKSKRRCSQKSLVCLSANHNLVFPGVAEVRVGCRETGERKGERSNTGACSYHRPKRVSNGQSPAREALVSWKVGKS